MICTTAGAAEVLGVHYSTAKQMVADGTLIPEATAAGQPLWRCETVRRWGKTRKPGQLPPSPPLEVWSAQELAERFDKEHVSVRVKASTAKGYRRLLERTILPALGRRRVT